MFVVLVSTAVAELNSLQADELLAENVRLKAENGLLTVENGRIAQLETKNAHQAQSSATALRCRQP